MKAGRLSVLQSTQSKELFDSTVNKKSQQDNLRRSVLSTRSIDSERLNRLSQPKAITVKFKKNEPSQAAAKAADQSKSKNNNAKRTDEPTSQNLLEGIDASFKHLELRDTALELEQAATEEQDGLEEYQDELNNFLNDQIDPLSDEEEPDAEEREPRNPERAMSEEEFASRRPAPTRTSGMEHHEEAKVVGDEVLNSDGGRRDEE